MNESLTGPTDPIAGFRDERRRAVASYPSETTWQETTLDWVGQAFTQRYMYNFDWLGRPLIQFPADIVAFQEVVWSVRPSLIIETGIAHGGSLMLSASILAMLEYADAVDAGTTLDPAAPRRTVLGIDIDIRSHNREAIDAHPLRSRIDMLEGSSVADETAEQVRERAAGHDTVLVVLDSNHTHDHVARELALYAPLVTPGSYCVVLDTIIEDLPPDAFPDRPWSPGNSPRSAVLEFLASHPDFEVDRATGDKLLISAAPGGWLRRRS